MMIHGSVRKAPRALTLPAVSDSPAVSDAGFSLVEIVVAMFVLAGLALMLAPVLVASLKQSAQNAIAATADHMVSSQLDLARAQTPTCQALYLFVAQGVADVQGGQLNSSGTGVTLQTTQTLGTCPAAYPGTVTYTVSVKRADTGAALVHATALLYVQSDS